ncbi:ligase-associated DNA damage response endonuclease PdeM [Nafulsella turpanensis]|uniref:ligase-associated DNA damage response endonuclease PdeM n=1 Tax=Nafulsella turpanensis TaxID=1265690 RepID=UPI0003461D1F|nr:ligase-associated DNA damage response endonuclease PdeM [Nafulsella turpanensis]
MKLNTLTGSAAITFPFMGQQLQLFPDKAIFWKEQKSLLLSDVHLGKAAHFRKAGIAVPGTIHRHDLERISNLIHQTGAERVLFLGDLFHSELNKEWWFFEEWLHTHQEVQFVLIKGNHDILPPAIYQQSRLKIAEEELILSPFILTHEPLNSKKSKKGLYNICGHIHPAIKLRGGAFQQLRLPCFYFGLHYALLPAFGKFTGFYQIKPKKEDIIFAIAEDRVLHL